MAGTRSWKLTTAFGAVYLAWGSTYLAIRFAVETLPPFLMAGTRHMVAGAILYGWARRNAAAPTRLHWRSAVIIGGLLLLGGNGGVSWAEQFVPSGTTALIVATVPLWMVLLHWSGEGRRTTTGRTALGVLLGFGGVLLLVNPGSAGGVNLVGAGVLVLDALLWAAGSLYARRAPLPSVPLLAVGMELLAGGVWLIGAGLLLNEPSHLQAAAITVKSAAALAYLVVVGSIVGFTAYIYLLNHSTPAQASTYAYVNPIVAVLLGAAFAHEPFAPRTALAAAIILAAVVLITIPSRKAPAGAAATPAQVAETN